jgi:hypothetical protein
MHICCLVTLCGHIPEDSLLSLGDFKYRLSRGRRVVESAVEILAGKWRILNSLSKHLLIWQTGL